MKIRYTEKLIREVIQEQIQTHPEAPEVIALFKISHPVMGYIKKANGEKSLLNCVIDINEKGLLVVIMDLFRADKARAAQVHHFSDIHGIKIREGWLNYSLILRYPDREDFKFQLMKRSTKHLPNQHDNLQYIIDNLSREFRIPNEASAYR